MHLESDEAEYIHCSFKFTVKKKKNKKINELFTVISSLS